MFILDDIAKSPFKGMMFLAREVAKAAEQEKEEQRLTLMDQLTELHRQFEAGTLDEDAFDEQEQAILDLLESFEQA